MSKRPVSLKTLAQALGVSISTVSRALRNHPDIGPELTQRVHHLAQQLHYSPNPLTMGLLKNATRIIGVIVPALEPVMDWWGNLGVWHSAEVTPATSRMRNGRLWRLT